MTHRDVEFNLDIFAAHVGAAFREPYLLTLSAIDFNGPPGRI